MSKKQKPPETATILIRLNGDETTATLIRDEFPTQTIRRTCARRNPADRYDAYEGARIALARLYGKEPFPAGREKEAEEAVRKPLEPSFRVGDVVRTDDGLPFTVGCQNCVAVVCKAEPDTLLSPCYIRYELRVRGTDGRELRQVCHELPGEEAPMKLLLRGGDRHG